MSIKAWRLSASLIVTSPDAVRRTSAMAAKASELSRREVFDNQPLTLRSVGLNLSPNIRQLGHPGERQPGELISHAFCRNPVAIDRHVHCPPAFHFGGSKSLHNQRMPPEP